MRIGWTIAFKLLVPFLLVALNTGARADDLDEEFNGALNQERWCACQLDPKNLTSLVKPDPEEAGDDIVSVTVDKASMGDRECNSTCFAPPVAAFSEVEDAAEEVLGPSLVMSDEAEWKPEKKTRKSILHS